MIEVQKIHTKILSSIKRKKYRLRGFALHILWTLSRYMKTIVLSSISSLIAEIHNRFSLGKCMPFVLTASLDNENKLFISLVSRLVSTGHIKGFIEDKNSSFIGKPLPLMLRAA